MWSCQSLLVVMNNKLYFKARNSADGYELWTSDGTEAGTAMVVNLVEKGNGFEVRLILTLTRICQLRSPRRQRGVSREPPPPAPIHRALTSSSSTTSFSSEEQTKPMAWNSGRATARPPALAS